MAMYIIDEKCIECGACWAECPLEAFVRKGKFAISSEKCVDCGACAYVCHYDSICNNDDDAVIDVSLMTKV